jgi:hypothetical protein
VDAPPHAGVDAPLDALEVTPLRFEGVSPLRFIEPVRSEGASGCLAIRHLPLPVVCPFQRAL